MDIELINNSDLNNTEDIFDGSLLQKTSKKEINSIRFSYLMERKLLKHLKRLKKENTNITGYKQLDDYLFKINSDSFFLNDSIKRIEELFSNYLKYKNITAKLGHEIETGIYDDSVRQLSSKNFSDLFYNSNDSSLYIGLYIEHLARTTILQSCVEYLINNGVSNLEDNSINIPQTIKKGLIDIFKDPYFYRYPIFWQFFTNVMGGFILTDLKDEEVTLRRIELRFYP
jgi:hypothetical protein